MFGIYGIKRDAKTSIDPFAARKGEPMYDDAFNLAAPSNQRRAVRMCSELRRRPDLVLKIDSCVLEALQAWGEARSIYGSFPFTPENNFYRALSDFVKAFPRYQTDVGLQHAPGSPLLHVNWMRVRVQTTVPMGKGAYDVQDEYNAWIEYLSDFNTRPVEGEEENSPPPPHPSVRTTGGVWVDMATEVAAVEGTKLAILISTGFAVGAIVIFTGNVIIALLALVSLLTIVATVLGFFQIIGWRLGIIEAVSITILVGLSCDFSLHLAEAYSQSTFHGRGNRGKDAVTRVGSPIFAAAFTTFLAVVPMLGCTIQVLAKFGAIIPVCIVLSLFYGLHLFTPLLMMVGPAGNLRGFLRGLPSIVFRTQARRIMFMFITAVLFSLVMPVTRRIVAVSLPSFIPIVVVVFLCLALWVRVELAKEEQGIIQEDPTVQESRFQGEGEGEGSPGDHLSSLDSPGMRIDTLFSVPKNYVSNKVGRARRDDEEVAEFHTLSMSEN